MKPTSHFLLATLFLALTVISLSGLSFLCTVAQTQSNQLEEDDSWKSIIDIDDPPPPPAPAPQVQTDPSRPATLPGMPPPEKKKSRWWPFGRKAADEKPVPDEKITQVGPRQYPAQPDPLLRLPVSIQPEEAAPTLLPGFYLARLTPPDTPTTLTLLQYGKAVTTIPLHPTESVTEGPVQPINGKPQPMVRVRLSENQKMLTILVKHGTQLYESPALPTVLDRKPVIQY